jgi:hypothetical protein
MFGRGGIALACAAALSGCGVDPCDDLQAALDDARAGETVELGRCTVTGEFSIPAGVALDGEGDRSVVRSSGVAIAMGESSAIRELRIESSSVAIDAQSATIERVTVVADRGIGVRIRGSSVLRAVEIAGPVTAENADAVPPGPTASETATHGLVIEDAGTEAIPVVLEDVTVRGFAGFGAVLIASAVSWSGGGAVENLGTGIFASGGRLTLGAVEIAGTLGGVQPLPAYGAVFSGGVVVTTTDLFVHDNDAYGLLEDSSESSHAALVAESNGDVALWVQAGRVTVGSSSRLSGNRIAGIALVETASATVRDSTIDTTEEGIRIDGQVGTVRVGDGLLAVLPDSDSILLENLTLMGNERAGIVIDVESAAIGEGVLENVTVDAVGAAFGVVAQSPAGPIAAGAWDDGVTRTGAAVANDAAITSRLDIVGIVGPMFLPDPS